MTQDKSKYDVKGTKTLLAIDATNEDILNLLGELDVRGLRVVPFVWDTDTLQNVRMQQPATAAGIEDLTDATTGSYWAETRIEYSGSNIQYIGYNETMNATTSGIDWLVKKLTYSGANVVRIQAQTTSWDDRTLGWT